MMGKSQMHLHVVEDRHTMVDQMSIGIVDTSAAEHSLILTFKTEWQRQGQHTIMWMWKARETTLFSQTLLGQSASFPQRG